MLSNSPKPLCRSDRVLLSVFSHRNGEAVASNDGIDSLISKLESSSMIINIGSKKSIRSDIRDLLTKSGWSGEARLFPARSAISITAIKGSTGLCLQLGNISRYYADVIKLQHMYSTKEITGGVLIVYLGTAAKRLFPSGGNLATFERIEKELKLMKNSITVPLTVIGIG